MNLEKVLDKVNEVKFFSEKLHEFHSPLVPGNPDTFRYYFSAFLNAAYSVEQFAEAEVMVELRGQGKKKSKHQVWQEYKKGWYDTLTTEQRGLWSSLSRIRGTETHQKRTKTTAKQKAVPLTDFPPSQATQAYKAFYVMQQAWGFPDVDLTSLTKELGLPPGTRASSVSSYVSEHYVEIEGKSRSIPEVSKEIVNLCGRFVKHLQTVPI